MTLMTMRRDLEKKLAPERVRVGSTSLKDVHTIPSLCRHLGISSGDWDGLLITDGSATTYSNTAGWAGVLIEAKVLQRRMFYGGFSGGTNNVAEIMAVVQTVLALASEDANVRTGGYRLHVISDSKYVVDGLNNPNMHLTSGSANRGLWFAIQGCRRDGIVCTGHHIPRDSIELNKLAHATANVARKAQIDLDAEVFEVFGGDATTTMPD